MVRRVAIGILSFVLAAGLAACSSNDAVLSSGGVPGIGPNFGPLSMYVTNSTQNAVSIFAPNAASGASPINQIGGSSTQLNGPQYDAFDTGKRLYVTNFNAGTSVGSVTVYASQAAGNVLPQASVSGTGTGIGYPRGIATDASSNFYVANVGSGPTFVSSILVYGAGSSGVVPPILAITGASTGLNFPTGIALDSKANMYVANTGSASGNGTITIYAASSSGNIVPQNTIGGPLTGLVNPTGIALDAQNNIYVCDKTTNSVSVFATGASGNVPPARSFTSSALNNPSDLKLDANGNLYVTNTANGNGSGSILVFPSSASGNVSPARTIPAPGNVVGIALSP